MSDITLGFVGMGFVGGAGYRAFSGYFDTVIYDKGQNIGSMEEVAKADVIFVAVPTPMKKDGSCDTSVVEQVVTDLDKLVESGTEIAVRSTVPPLWFYEVASRMKNGELLFVPEFLTERTADQDFLASPRFILGVECVSDPNTHAKTKQVFEERFPRTRVSIMTWEEASLVKYGTNTFFTTKLSFFNELYKLADKLGANPDVVVEEVINDGRIGRSHFKVPGPDGDFGWGGHCFPKDNRALKAIADAAGIEFDMVQSAWDVNERMRGDRDWERQKGRAVVED